MQTWYPRARVLLDVVLEDWTQAGSLTVCPFDVIPREVEWEHCLPRTADEAKVTLDFRQLPIDPRAIKAIRVGIFAGHVDDPTQDLPTSDDYRVYLGVVEKPETVLADEGETVTLSCRDYTTVFLSTPWKTAIDIQGKTLPQVVESIRKAIPAAEGITVQPDSNASFVVLSDLLGRSKWTPREKDDAWTAISDLCGLAGFIPLISLDKLRITTSNALGSNQVAMLYGANVSRLVYRRHDREVHTRQVKVLCWDEQARESREGVWPATPAGTKIVVGPKKAAKVPSDARIITHRVTGSYTTQQLQDLAQCIYEEFATTQLDGELETRELRDLDGQTNLWQLEYGDLLTVNVGKMDPGIISGMSQSEAVAFLTSGRRGLDEAVATALVVAWSDAQHLQPKFIVRKAAHRWSVSDGYQLHVEFAGIIGG